MVHVFVQTQVLVPWFLVGIGIAELDATRLPRLIRYYWEGGKWGLRCNSHCPMVGGKILRGSPPVLFPPRSRGIDDYTDRWIESEFNPIEMPLVEGLGP